MPLPRSLRPTILPSARHLSSIPFRLLCSPVIHQHHHRRTTTTLRPSAEPQNHTSFAGFAIAAATFGAVFWLYPKRSINATVDLPPHIDYAIYSLILEKFIIPELDRAFHKYLGCQNFRVALIQGVTSDTAPDDGVVNFADLQMVLCLDADAASENIEGNIIGVCIFSKGREEMELVSSLRQLLKVWDSDGLLKREGMAVCLVCCKGVDGIWVYGKEGVEVEGADSRVGEEEGGWMSRILSVKKNW